MRVVRLEGRRIFRLSLHGLLADSPHWLSMRRTKNSPGRTTSQTCNNFPVNDRNSTSEADTRRPATGAVSHEVERVWQVATLSSYLPCQPPNLEPRAWCPRTSLYEPPREEGPSRAGYRTSGIGLMQAAPTPANTERPLSTVESQPRLRRRRRIGRKRDPPPFPPPPVELYTHDGAGKAAPPRLPAGPLRARSLLGPAPSLLRSTRVDLSLGRWQATNTCLFSSRTAYTVPSLALRRSGLPSCASQSKSDGHQLPCGGPLPEHGTTTLNYFASKQTTGYAAFGSP